MIDFTNYKQKIILDGIKDSILKSRYLLLLQTDDHDFVGFRITRQKQAFIDYSFSDQTAGFSLAANQFSKGNSLSIRQLSGVSNWLATDIQRSTNNIMQVFYGIAPSYVFASLEYGGPGQYQVQMPVSSVLPREQYPYIYDTSGFVSPFFAPAESTEFYVLNQIDVQFTLYNSVNIPVVPRMLFVVNNLKVEPVSQGLFKKMLLGQVPRRLAEPGQIYAAVGYAGQGYGNVEPVNDKDILSGNAAALKAAGYPAGEY